MGNFAGNRLDGIAYNPTTTRVSAFSVSDTRPIFLLCFFSLGVFFTPNPSSAKLASRFHVRQFTFACV
jgi:hypothetical protein